jgi:hypothetical protein
VARDLSLEADMEDGAACAGCGKDFGETVGYPRLCKRCESRQEYLNQFDEEERRHEEEEWAYR